MLCTVPLYGIDLLREVRFMRRRGLMVGAVCVIAWAGLAGCENTQGTSANPDLTRESVNYKNNDDPQNTAAGSGVIGKPPEAGSVNIGGEPASQASIKGTDNANSAPLTSGEMVPAARNTAAH